MAQHYFSRFDLHDGLVFSAGAACAVCRLMVAGFLCRIRGISVSDEYAPSSIGFTPDATSNAAYYAKRPLSPAFAAGFYFYLAL